VFWSGQQFVTVVLHGVRVLERTAVCYSSADQVQLNAEISGKAEFQATLPRIIPAPLLSDVTGGNGDV
jgi:hypothetical protein